MRIERASVADAELCFAIQRAAAVAGFQHVFPAERYPFPDDAVRSAWLAALADPTVEAFVAFEDDGAVGSVSIGFAQLRTLYVVPGAWGRGVGGALHDLALERLSAAGAAEARLWTLTENQRARGFYERRGWRLTGETRVVPFPPYPIDVEYARAL